MSGSRERLWLGAIILGAAFVRLYRLDLMEFKVDEPEACRLALGLLGAPMPEGEPVSALTGLTSSLGLPHPPLFIYFMMLPLALWSDPLSAVALVALSNIAAVGLCWFIGRRYYSPFVGLAAAALFALSPAAIVYSRKIWQQDMLALFACLFLLTAHAFAVDKKPREAFWLVLLWAMMTQLHFSAFALAPVLWLVLRAGPRPFPWRWFGAGLIAAAVLYAPYLWHLLRNAGHELALLAARLGGPAGGTSVLAVLQHWLGVGALQPFDRLLGTEWQAATSWSVLFGVGGIAGWLWFWKRPRQATPQDLRAAVLLWWVLPPAAVVLLGIASHPHYFLVLYPLPFLGAALALEATGQRRPAACATLLVALLAIFAWVDGRFFHQLIVHGGAPAEYGVAYRHKAAAIDFALAENPDRPFLLSSEFALNKPVPMEYRFILWQRLVRREQPFQTDQPAFGYVLVDPWREKIPVEQQSRPPRLRAERFGPLLVYEVPVAWGGSPAP